MFRGKHRYKCGDCGKNFTYSKQLDANSLYNEYLFGKQTLGQLAEKYSKSPRTIRRRLDTVRSTRVVSSQKQVIVLVDATYWGRRFGVLAFKDWKSKRILWRKFLSKKETLADYQEGLDWLQENDFKIEGVVCDGLKGLFNLFGAYKVQMCQFHQYKIVERKLTKNPTLEASKELLDIAKLLCHTDKESFIGVFEEWCLKWDSFLKERSIDPKSGKNRYVHRPVRSAMHSIKRNMKYLWTWYDFIEIGIPNTNNSLEGQFSDLKNKLRNHNGLRRRRKMVFIDEYFKKTFAL